MSNLTEIVKTKIDETALWGDRYRGSFAEGFTYTSNLDVGRGQDGKYYRYIGDASYPVTVAADTIAENFPNLYEITISNDRTAISVDSIIDIISGNDTELREESSYIISGYYPDSDTGGGIFNYKEQYELSLHNGGTVLSLSAITDWKDAALALGGVTKQNLFATINTFLQSSQTGIGPAIVRQSKSISTKDFGLLDDEFSEDSLEAFNNAVCSDRFEEAHYIGSIKAARKITIGSMSVDAPKTATLRFDLKIDSSYYTSNEEALDIDGLTFTHSYGVVQVICGDSANARNHLDGIKVSRAERCMLPDMRVFRVKRDGIRFTTDPKTSFAQCGLMKVTDTGYIHAANASNYINNGSANSVSQSTTLTVDSTPDYFEVGDFVMSGGEPYRITTINNNDITVYPWIVNPTSSVTIVTGSGVRVVGGDSSLLSLGTIDGIRCGVLYRPDALYPPMLNTLHGNIVGIGIAIGRDRNSALGGGILSFYLEGGGNRLYEMVETSTAVSGFFIGSCGGGVTGDLIKNMATGNSGGSLRETQLKTNILSMQGTFVAAVGSSRNNTQFSSSVTLRNRAITPQASYIRNVGTVNLQFDTKLNDMTGCDLATLYLYGTGTNSNASTLTVNPPSGWTVNGSASKTISGITKPLQITFFYDILNSNVIVSYVEMVMV